MKKFWNTIEDNICAVLLLAMMLLTCVNVFARYVLKSSMPFVEELTNAGLIVLSLAGAATAAKRGAHLGLTVLTDHLPPAAQKFCDLLGYGLGIVFGVILMVYGWRMATHELDLGLKTAGMQWPEGIFGMIIPISGVVLTIRYTQLFILRLMNKKIELGEDDEKEVEE